MSGSSTSQSTTTSQETTDTNTAEESNPDEPECPLCLERLDLTERNFKPCKCGYQVCSFCWHHITEQLNAKCPACRAPYRPKNFQFTAPDPKVLAQQLNEKRERKKIKKANKHARETGAPKHKQDKDLSNVRVLQRNLLYVVGLPPSIAKEELLRKKEMFGKFGRIIKVAITKRQAHGDNHPHTANSYTAYITYKKDKSAMEAINAINGSLIDGRTVRATYGTTKYCTYFLRNIACNNPNCLYLHSLAKDMDCFTKENLTHHYRDHTVCICNHTPVLFIYIISFMCVCVHMCMCVCMCLSCVNVFLRYMDTCLCVYCSVCICYSWIML